MLPSSGYLSVKASTALMEKISTKETYSITPADTPKAAAKALVLA